MVRGGRCVWQRRDRGICRPMPLRGRSRSSLRVYWEVREAEKKRGRGEPHGAMIIRAPGTGSWGRSFEVVTWASQPSSSLESLYFPAEYHEPAWLASRIVIVDVFGMRLELRGSGLLMEGSNELELEGFSADKRWLVLSTRDIYGLSSRFCLTCRTQRASKFRLKRL
jgi:hypothetical protein